MKLYYFGSSANFGDCLNEWLWHRLLPGRWDPADGIRFSGIGTIINSHMPASRRWVVFTSGVGYGGLPAGFGGGGWTVASVRGPLSAAVLGLPPSAAVTDGAILLATLPELARLGGGDRGGVVFVPHHEAETAAAWPEACRRAGVEYLSPLGDSRGIVERIGRARLVLAEAMHAAIVADTLRVPWVPVVSSPQVSTFKWLDWTLSMGLPYDPLRLPASTTGSQWRNAMLWAYDQVHHFRAGRERSAIAYFERRYRRRSAADVGMRRIARRLHRKADRLLGSPALSGWRNRRDEALIDRAAAALERASGQDGWLSEDRIFEARIGTLQARLAELR